MSTRVDPAFLGTLKKYGAFDISDCFNCGNCTAVCPLSKGTDSFPRRMIRYAQIGARDRLLGCKEVWQCFYCGECSDTCPRQAEPGEFMAAARRYSIASFDPTGISHLLYRSRLFTALFLSVLSALFALLLLSDQGPMAVSAPLLFQFHQIEGFLSYDLVHNMGLSLIIIAAAVMIAGILRMTQRLSRSFSYSIRGDEDGQPGLLSRAVSAARVVGTELTVHSSFRDCKEEPQVPWYLDKRFLHWSIMWGFIGLLVATGTDWLLDMTVGKVPGQPVAIWHPTRLLGTLAGIFVVYGTGATIIHRWTKPDKYFSHTLLSDWLLLWLLFLACVTGFVVEITVYLHSGAGWIYIILLIHVVISMELVILLPFTKFAHAFYRPLALFIHNMYRPAAGQKKA